VYSRNNKDRTKNILLNVPSRISEIRRVSDGILDWLKSYKADEDTLFDIKLCVEEAVRNAIVHGNKSDEAKTVKVSYRLDGADVVIEVEDEGAGFNKTTVPDPTKDENLMKGSGRGVYLIDRLMDEVEYNNKGNLVRMRKRITTRRA